MEPNCTRIAEASNDQNVGDVKAISLVGIVQIRWVA